jgi:hypothetical protein
MDRVPEWLPHASKGHIVSHIVQIQTQVRDAAAVEIACQRLALPPPQHRQVQMYSAAAEGLAVELPGWRYPLVCELSTGRLAFDHFGGHWGDPRELDRFLQAYAVEKSRLEARRRGHTFSEQALADGSIRLLIEVGGGGA